MPFIANDLIVAAHGHIWAEEITKSVELAGFPVPATWWDHFKMSAIPTFTRWFNLDVERVVPTKAVQFTQYVAYPKLRVELGRGVIKVMSKEVEQSQTATMLVAEQIVNLTPETNPEKLAALCKFLDASLKSAVKSRPLVHVTLDTREVKNAFALARTEPRVWQNVKPFEFWIHRNGKVELRNSKGEKVPVEY